MTFNYPLQYWITDTSILKVEPSSPRHTTYQPTETDHLSNDQKCSDVIAKTMLHLTSEQGQTVALGVIVGISRLL